MPIRNPEENRIVQLITPATPVFAVYHEGDSARPEKPEDLVLYPCPVMALIENKKSKEQDVIGLCVEMWGLEQPNEDNFLGYANSKGEAELHYIKKPRAKRL